MCKRRIQRDDGTRLATEPEKRSAGREMCKQDVSEEERGRVCMNVEEWVYSVEVEVRRGKIFGRSA